LSYGAGLGLGLRAGYVGLGIRFLPDQPLSAGSWWIRALVGTAVIVALFLLAWVKVVALGN
jgi:hypothetical protein